MNTYIQKRLAKIQMTLDEMSGGYRRMVNGMKKLGFAGSLKAIWDDLLLIVVLEPGFTSYS